MKPEELRAIEEEIAALRRRSDQLAARLAEPREKDVVPGKSTDSQDSPSLPTNSELDGEPE